MIDLCSAVVTLAWCLWNPGEVIILEPEPEVTVVEEPWTGLADCESGNWLDGGRAFEESSARWDWGVDLDELPPWASVIDRGDGPEAQFHGGLQFHPDTWSWVASDILSDPPPYAYLATRGEQVRVAEEVQRRQGWRAWPVCSRKVGLR